MKTHKYMLNMMMLLFMAVALSDQDKLRLKEELKFIEGGVDDVDVQINTSTSTSTSTTTTTVSSDNSDSIDISASSIKKEKKKKRFRSIKSNSSSSSKSEISENIDLNMLEKEISPAKEIDSNAKNNSAL
ncbi:MAG: hypothetical protein HQK49_14950 [Oligoflexia bacterium]|nr:hypothetical protein [Oligoflexia bacterium]